MVGSLQTKHFQRNPAIDPCLQTLHVTPLCFIPKMKESNLCQLRKWDDLLANTCKQHQYLDYQKLYIGES